jgi:hypothetical protein
MLLRRLESGQLALLDDAEGVVAVGGDRHAREPHAAAAKAQDLRRLTTGVVGGGYICGPDHHIKPDVPPANAVALFRAATAFRRPGYTRP